MRPSKTWRSRGVSAANCCRARRGPAGVARRQRAKAVVHCLQHPTDAEGPLDQIDGARLHQGDGLFDSDLAAHDRHRPGVVMSVDHAPDQVHAVQVGQNGLRQHAGRRIVRRVVQKVARRGEASRPHSMGPQQADQRDPRIDVGVDDEDGMAGGAHPGVGGGGGAWIAGDGGRQGQARRMSGDPVCSPSRRGTRRVAAFGDGNGSLGISTYRRLHEEYEALTASGSRTSRAGMGTLPERRRPCPHDVRRRAPPVRFSVKL